MLNAPVVSIEQGKLKGSVEKLVDGNLYYSFKGIPYAQPPIGKLRFQAPLPPLPWQSIHDATEYGAACPQMDIFTSQAIEGNEDCLFLNVYSKSLTNDKKPVIVYIHGGAFMSGSGNSDIYGPEYLVQHDVVLVTINYRLEVLGFLCLDTEEVPGNAGMKDQVAALKWVKKNISSFGGDPGNVTLMGESAGAVSVTYHMLSSMSRNLFHRAIVQSGTCLSDWSQGVDSTERAFRVGKLLGNETKDVNDLLKFLRSVPATDLASVTFKTMSVDEKKRGLPIHFCPVIEKKFSNVESYINEDSLKLLMENKFHDVPLLIGYNNGEGMLMLLDFIKKMDFYNKNLHYKLPRGIADRVSEDKLKQFADRLRTFYFGGKDLTLDLKNEMAALQSDLFFVYDIHRFVNVYSTMAASPVYMYRFMYDSELNIMKAASGFPEFKGAVHADDLFYLFSNNVTKELVAENERTRLMINEVTKLWTNFAKTGNPTPDGSLGVEWRPFTNKSKYFLSIDTPLSLGQNADKENVNFWNKIYSESGLPCVTKSNL